MPSTKKHSTSILTIKEVLETGFVAKTSSYTHSLVCDYYRESSSASKQDTWERLMDMDNATKSSSLCVVKQSESLSGSMKALGISDLSVVCFCKSHHGLATPDLSGEYPGRAGCLMDVTMQNTSTPYKKTKHPKLLENLLSRSTELAGDLSTLGKSPARRWEISAIKTPLDTSLSLDVSSEELKFLGCSRSDPTSLDTSVVVPLPWPGAFKKNPVLTHGSASPEILLGELDSVPSHQPL